MKIFHVRNVCIALSEGINFLWEKGLLESSRNGPVRVAPQPVITVTYSPMERVLFSAHRNANPFFHLFEAIWMLAGRDDAAPLDVFIHDFGSRFAEPSGRVHGAYGHRWRHHFIHDQLSYVVNKLRQDPTNRQGVISMWDCDSDLDGNYKDRPCNTHIYLRLRDGALDLTACCRSNDAIWGAHGANAVHFSVLQEYLAAQLGAEVGLMYQISNNYHTYLTERDNHSWLDNRYMNGQTVQPMPMFTEPDDINDDIARFMAYFEGRNYHSDSFSNPWFGKVLVPMMMAHHKFKAKDKPQALWFADRIEASDWRVASREWLERRK